MHKDSLPNTTICKSDTVSNSQTYFTPPAEPGCTYQGRYSEHLNRECCHRENSVMIITDVFLLQCLVILEKENIGDIKQMLMKTFTFFIHKNYISVCLSHLIDAVPTKPAQYPQYTKASQYGPHCLNTEDKHKCN